MAEGPIRGPGMEAPGGLRLLLLQALCHNRFCPALSVGSREPLEHRASRGLETVTQPHGSRALETSCRLRAGGRAARIPEDRPSRPRSAQLHLKVGQATTCCLLRPWPTRGSSDTEVTTEGGSCSA